MFCFCPFIPVVTNQLVDIGLKKRKYGVVKIVSGSTKMKLLNVSIKRLEKLLKNLKTLKRRKRIIKVKKRMLVKAFLTTNRGKIT